MVIHLDLMVEEDLVEKTFDGSCDGTNDGDRLGILLGKVESDGCVLDTLSRTHMGCSTYINDVRSNNPSVSPSDYPPCSK